MAGEFEEGQHILVYHLIQSDPENPVPPGRYVIAEVTHDLLGSRRYRVRSLPDEDIEAEVDLETLSQACREDTS